MLTVEQSETLKYLYLLFSDPEVLPFEGERCDVISSVGTLIDLSLMSVALFYRLRIQH